MDSMDRCDKCHVAKATYSVDEIPFRFDDNGTLPVGQLLLCDHHTNRYMAALLSNGYSLNRI